LRLHDAEHYADFVNWLLPSLTSAAAALLLSFQTPRAFGASPRCGAPSPPDVASYQHLIVTHPRPELIESHLLFLVGSRRGGSRRLTRYITFGKSGMIARHGPFMLLTCLRWQSVSVRKEHFDRVG
jgi:hypothetical protein